MTIVIDKGEGRDVVDVMPVMRAAFDHIYGEAWSQSQLTELLMMPGNWMFILRLDNVIAGFAVSRSTLDEAELMLLAVSPDFRGRGFGQKLLEEVISEARRHGAVRLFLEMRADNENALALYEKAGFFPVGQRPQYYRGTDGVLRDAITMSRSLD